MANFFEYVIYSFSLIPTWLTAIFIALFVFVVTYLCLVNFANRGSVDSVKSNDPCEKNAEFDNLLAMVLASKEKGNNMNANVNIKQPDIKIQKSVSPAVVAAISAVVSRTCPGGTICSIEST